MAVTTTNPSQADARSPPALIVSTLKPIIWLFKVYGIPLDAVSSGCCWSSFGGLFVLFNLATSIVFIWCTVAAQTTAYTAKTLNTLLDRANLSVFTVGIHLTFFLAHQRSRTWRQSIWHSIQLIQRHIKLDRTFYWRATAVCCLGLVFIGLEAAAVVYTNMSLPTAKGTLLMKASLGTVRALQVVAQSVMILFGLLALAASDLFRILSSQLNDSKTPCPILLERWKGHHALVARFVHQLNETFGVTLLTAIGSAFVAFIANTFSLVISMQAGQAVFNISFIIFLTKHSARLAWIISSAYRIKSSVMDVSLILRQFHFPSSDLKVQIKLNGLTAQVNETGRFRITAKDFFEVNNQLIPSLMGTTLTYFIILYQMDSVGQ